MPAPVDYEEACVLCELPSRIGSYQQRVWCQSSTLRLPRMNQSPNHALQRTAPCVTAPASTAAFPPAMQVPRRTPRSLSLGSLGDLHASCSLMEAFLFSPSNIVIETFHVQSLEEIPAKFKELLANNPSLQVDSYIVAAGQSCDSDEYRALSPAGRPDSHARNGKGSFYRERPVFGGRGSWPRGYDRWSHLRHGWHRHDRLLICCRAWYFPLVGGGYCVRRDPSFQRLFEANVQLRQRERTIGIHGNLDSTNVA